MSCNTAEHGWYFNRLVQSSVGHLSQHSTVPETLISDAGPIVPACDSEQPQKETNLKLMGSWVVLEIAQFIVSVSLIYTHKSPSYQALQILKKARLATQYLLFTRK